MSDQADERYCYVKAAALWGGSLSVVTAALIMWGNDGNPSAQALMVIVGAMLLGAFIGVTNVAEPKNELRWLLAVRFAVLGALGGAGIVLCVFVVGDVVCLIIRHPPADVTRDPFIVAAIACAFAALHNKGFFPRPKPPAELDPAVRRELIESAAKGIVIGAGAAGIASWIGIIPAHELTEWAGSIAFGACTGMFVCTHRILRDYCPSVSDDIAMSGLLGALIGAALLFIVSILWFFVKDDSNHWATNIDIAFAGALLGGIIPAWRRSRQLQAYRRLRLLLGGVLSIVAGEAFVSGGLIFIIVYEVPLFFPLLQTAKLTFPWIFQDGGQVLRGLAVTGALFGLGSFLAWQFSGRGPAS